jgi:hypothetical protein
VQTRICCIASPPAPAFILDDDAGETIFETKRNANAAAPVVSLAGRQRAAKNPDRLPPERPSGLKQATGSHVMQLSLTAR